MNKLTPRESNRLAKLLATQTAILELCRAYWAVGTLENRHASMIGKCKPVILGKAAINLVVTGNSRNAYVSLQRHLEDCADFGEVVNMNPADEDPVYALFLCLTMILPAKIRIVDDLREVDPTAVGIALQQLQFSLHTIECARTNWRSVNDKSNIYYGVEMWFRPWAAKIAYLLGLDLDEVYIATKLVNLELLEKLLRSGEGESSLEVVLEYIATGGNRRSPIRRYWREFYRTYRKYEITLHLLVFLIPLRRLMQAFESHVVFLNQVLSTPRSGIPASIIDLYKVIKPHTLPLVNDYQSLAKTLDDVIYDLEKFSPKSPKELSMIRKGFYSHLRVTFEFDDPNGDLLKNPEVLSLRSRLHQLHDQKLSTLAYYAKKVFYGKSIHYLD